MKKAELRNCSGTRSAVSTFTTEHRDTEKTQVWKNQNGPLAEVALWLCGEGGPLLCSLDARCRGWRDPEPTIKRCEWAPP